MEKIWHDQNVYIIEGTHSRLGVGNNLFENVKNLKRILVPAVNAFDSYDEILSSAIKNCAKSDLILLAIGPTATILSFDLAKLGYWAIDIGHIDIEYEWFKKQATRKVPVKNKYVNEANYAGQDNLQDKSYEDSIIEIIGN